MSHKIKRLLLGMILAVVAAGLLPITAAATQHPRIIQFSMGEACQIQLYLAAELEDALFGRVPISSVPTEEEVWAACREENRALTLKTDPKGEAKVDFSQRKLPDGVYLVMGDGFAPFYICVPAPEGDGWAYTVDVYPGYRIGGEAEPQPSEATLVPMQPEEELWHLESVILTMAGFWAFLRRILHLECG